ncbi:MAG TPA: Ig-like domain-containing protein, partial [Aquaticitalea sp.]|nr:Ig-like domain-containing protein [Aquaticitalea sp.]
MKAPKFPTLCIGNAIIACLFFLQSQISLSQLAFPAGEGAGAYVTGGRGGTVIHVTNLTNNNTPGSFRWALSQTYPRIIVFDVSGSIDLGGTTLHVSGNQYSNLTIAGQSAPEGGITIVNGSVWLERINNLILRYIKFRGGSYTTSKDALQISRASNWIIDHCEGWYGTDEGMDVGDSSVYGQDGNITISNCLIAESKTGLIMGKSWDGEDNWNFDYGPVSILRNAFINVSHRFPKAGGAFEMDVINNVVHNWQWRLMRLDPDDYKLNEINNYYQSGSNSSNDLNKTWSRNWMTPEIYTSGNYISSDKKPVGYDEDNSLGWKTFNDNLYPIQSNWFVSSPHPYQGVAPAVLTANNAKEYVLENVGAIHYLNADGSVGTYRDNLQITYLGYLENDGNVAMLDVVDYGTQATGVPSNSRPDGFYNSNPHIPETWFLANVPEGEDHNDIAPSGYTWLEEYLNGVDTPNEAVDVQSIAITPATAELQLTETVQLTATFTPANATNQNGTWTSSNPSVAIVNSSGLVTAVSSGDATITFTSADGGFTDTSQITVFSEALDASAGIDQQICEGTGTTLTATGGSSYEWSNGATTASIDVSPSATTTYTVTAYDAAGNSDTDDVTVTVNQGPNVNAGSNVTINQGESTTLGASG